MSVILYERESTSGATPRFNAYIEQSLPSSQTIAIDLNTSVFNGRSTHDYVETDEATGEIMTDTYTSIKDCNRTLSAELDYVKRWHRSRLTAGVRYNMARNRATRESGSVTRQHQDRTYLFAEYFQQISKVSLTGGIGAQYLDQRTRHTGKGTVGWSFRPRFSASYRLARSSQFRLNFSTWQTTPSLSQTNATPQQIDGFQYQIGNPDLKAYNNYRASFQYNFNFPKVTGRFEARWTRSPHQIAPYMEWKDDNLVTYFENSRGLTAWRFSFAPQIEIIPSVLTAKGSLKYYMAESSGRGYLHKCHNWSGDVSILAYYKNFSFMANYEVNPATLSG
ncbi:MAG: outer membrane beta-barrel family protein, partial [Duncaniella sp.]|nr:outer membrane beta-barrel family protein [Duncaniella sp.]